MGYEAVNPASIGEDVRTILPNPGRKDFLTADIMELLGCQGIVFFGDWWLSSGCRLECQIAAEFGMKFYRMGKDGLEAV